MIDDFLDSRDADAFRDDLERLSDARRRDGDDDGTTTMERRGFKKLHLIPLDVNKKD